MHDIFRYRMQVLLCPPPNCISTGCSGHHIWEKDVPSCGIDTSNSTTVGTTFIVSFVVYNSAGLSATTQRSITVISQCPSEKPNLCSDGSCHDVSCSTVNSLQSIPSNNPPLESSTLVLFLLPTSTTNFTSLALLSTAGSSSSPINQTVFTAYGQPAPFSFSPCSSSASLKTSVSCAAIAFQVFSNGSRVDVAFHDPVELNSQ